MSKKGCSVLLICLTIGFVLAATMRHVREMSELAVRPVRSEEELLELKMQACAAPLVGEGVIILMDDSKRELKAGENANVYVIHDADLLRVINELRAAGAEALSVNGQRLVATSEIRCAGPTLSVNNVRSAAPYEIRAIGDKVALENSIKMRGGVADTLSVWGIELEVTTSEKVYIPRFEGTFRRIYSHVAEE